MVIIDVKASSTVPVTLLNFNATLARGQGIG